MKKSVFYFFVAIILIGSYSCSDNEGEVEVNISMDFLSPQLLCNDTLFEPYGICAHITKDVDKPYIDGILDLMDDLHITWVRSDLEWSKISSEPGQMDFSFFDDAFSHLEKHPNIHLLPILTYYCNYPVSAENPLQINEYYQDWLSYLDRVVSRYSRYCPVWEGFNEWDYWIGNGSIAYANAVKYQADIYNTVKEYNSEAKTLLGSMMSVGEAYRILSSNGAQNYSDVANLHVYSTFAPENNYISTTEQLAYLLKNYNIERPLWVTEFGYSTSKEDNISEEEQAYLIPRNFIVGFSQGVNKMFLYSLRSTEANNTHESHFGIVHKDLSPKPAYYSVRTLTRMLPSGSTRPKLYNKGLIYVATWVNPEKGKVYAVWTKDASITVNLNIKGNPHFYSCSDLDNELNINDYDNFEIGPEIIYITGATAISF